jgi:hypothetical protein
LHPNHTLPPHSTAFRGGFTAIAAAVRRLAAQRATPFFPRCFSTDTHRPLAWPIKEGAKAYGEANFAKLRKIGAFYSDRSRYIHQLDSNRGVVFLRPPRFGKTSFLSMLEYYHDVRFKDRFDELFVGMDIHRDDTRDKTRQGSFHLLSIKLPASLGENTYTTFGDCINILSPISWMATLMCCRPLMVLVDEYDRAPMSALVSAEVSLDVERYNKAKEPLRDLLGALKAIHEDGAHFFVTGITPVAIAGESIWNNADHLTFHTEFADMLGLTRADVEAGLRQVAKIKDEEDCSARWRWPRVSTTSPTRASPTPTPSRTSETRRWWSSFWSSTARRSSATRSVMTKACVVTSPG